MSVVEVQFYSGGLDRTLSYTAFVPDVGTAPFPVLYQLHGRSDDHRAWLQRSNLVRYAADLPLLIVMPAAENSFYLGGFERLMIDELPAHVARTFHASDRAAIGGLSMGGYGAIRLGLKYPERYRSIFAHSSRLPARAELASLDWARGFDLDDLDVDSLAARAKNLPDLAFDCGTEDHLLADSRRFHARLESLGLSHRYDEHPGGHTWDYWDRHVQTALAHHLRALSR